MDHQRRWWTFLTNHARVLRAIARHPAARWGEVAASCQTTERTVQRIVADLEEAGYLCRERVGKRKRYIVNRDGPYRHPAQAGLTVRALLEPAVCRKHEDTNTSPSQ
ncbi:helix-turn-helix transcriptional regulator [Streptomyces spectabilis]|uniref:MarR family transcriptional regulator n=1 Tax=Streptomyces spectabilis TaxID=68270 RepID=A0A516R1N6_STRST|nr:helix-turn-helix domain-containing protein [Streptomyces spectabilis]QDQ09574.1 MarR family transcriptional regulator [Streptomyces spectabilis]